MIIMVKLKGFIIPYAYLISKGSTWRTHIPSADEISVLSPTGRCGRMRSKYMYLRNGSTGLILHDYYWIIYILQQGVSDICITIAPRSCIAPWIDLSCVYNMVKWNQIDILIRVLYVNVAFFSTIQTLKA